jgi:hypothetical protein
VADLGIGRLWTRSDLTAQGSIGFFYSEARNFFTTNQYVVSQSVQLITSATQTASTSLISSFLADNTVDAAGLAALGESEAGRMVLTRPFGYSEYNLRPFDQLAGEAATTAGAIYLIVSSAFSRRARFGR